MSRITCKLSRGPEAIVVSKWVQLWTVSSRLPSKTKPFYLELFGKVFVLVQVNSKRVNKEPVRICQLTLNFITHSIIVSLGNREAAISVIREAKNHIPNEPSVYFNLANMLGQKDEFLVREIFQRKSKDLSAH